jgi:hypothetical protein
MVNTKTKKEKETSKAAVYILNIILLLGSLGLNIALIIYCLTVGNIILGILLIIQLIFYMINISIQVDVFDDEFKKKINRMLKGNLFHGNTKRKTS